MPSQTQQQATKESAARPPETHERPAFATAAPVLAAGPGFDGPPDGLGALHDAIGNRALASVLEGGAPVLRRKCAECAAGGGTCAKCAAEEQTLRRSAAPGAPAPATAALPAAVATALGSSGGRSLDARTRAFMEARFGRGFGHVRIHDDQSAARAAEALDASAFTVGNAVWFGAGQFQPGQPAGLHLLAHELAHTVQQRGGAAAPQASSLRIGSAGDPAEHAADRVADAVLANRPVSRLGASGMALRRKPKVSPVSGNPAARIVELDDGKKYRVVRNVRLEQRTETIPADGSPKLKGKIDKNNIWLQVDWCKNTTRGDVKVGVDLPSAAQDVLKELGKSILNGTDPKDAVLSAKLEPFASVTIAQSQRFRLDISGKVTTEPFQGKATGGAASATLKLPNLDVSAEFKINEPPQGSGRTGPDYQVGVTVTIPFGGPGKVECPTRQRTIVIPQITYTCTELIPEHMEDKPTPVTTTQSHYLYFDYAKSEFATKDPGAKLNSASMAALQKALADKFKVTAIRGYASPEGPMEPNARFIGNKALSQNRADAARAWLEKACPPPSLLTMRPEEQGCFVPDLKPTGEGELYGTDAEGKELKGRPLARAAVGSFETEAAEERHRTPELEKQLEQRKGSPERQEDLVYPLLRRAEIDLSKTETRNVPTRVEASEKELDACPAEVVKAAEEEFERTPLAGAK